MSNVIIIAALAIILTFAIKNTVSHFKGESSCCGGGGRDVKTKPLPNPLLKRGSKNPSLFLADSEEV